MPALFPHLWYDSCYYFLSTALTLGFSLRVEGRRHVPRRGPVLMLCNHQSFLDPVVLGIATPRRVLQLARKTLFTQTHFAALIRSLGAVPVDQEGVAKEGLRIVIDLLRAGEAVVVFPEGERTPDGRMLPFRPGVQLILKRAPVPVLPLGIAGAFQALPRQRKWLRLSPLFFPATGADITVSIGRPLDGARLATLGREELMGELFNAVQASFQRAEKLRRKR